MDEFKNIIGYVEQEIMLRSNWTPSDHLDYYFDLRWSKGDTYKSRKKQKIILKEVIFDILKIDHCKDIKIGNLT